MLKRLLRPTRLPLASRGVTLVELLVAVALSVILVGVMTFVWVQSNEIFSTQLNRIETYQRVRNILDTIERDLANTQLTTDMEFFNDEDGNGFFDTSTTPPDTVRVSPGGGTGGGAAGGDMRAPVDPQDPLFRLGQPEFAVGPDPLAPNGADELNQADYQRAPLILSPAPYLIDQAEGYLQSNAYWRDEIYVRSFITIGDSNRPALIHYRLVQPTPGGRSLLRRRIWFLNAQGQLTNDTDQVDIRAVDVCDLKISFLFKLSPTFGDANVYHAAPPVSNYPSDPDSLKADLLNADIARGYVSSFGGRPPATNASGTSREIEPLSGQHTAFTDRVPFLYSGVAKLEERELGPTALRTLDPTAAASDPDDPADTGYQMSATPNLGQYGNFDFRGVRPGTQVLLFEAHDDDANHLTPTTAAAERFPARLWTIDTISAEGGTSLGDAGNFVSLRFLEKVPFARLRTSWLGDEPEAVIDSGMVSGTQGGPVRTVIASFNVKYRVGFLPSAFVVRLSVDDRFNQQVIPMERVVRLLQQ
ncbi:MAG TPA: hypothetical protein DEA08_26980 [Planctomycetes bacterium]|nr:hypothetical protein [Planctomycetota bacterium]